MEFVVTEMENLKRGARENLRRLLENVYPGRGIVLGKSSDGQSLLQVYWIMGRSQASRNRRFVQEGPTVRTEAALPEQAGGDPELLIYTAMRELSGHYLVSNGDHTDTLAEEIGRGRSFPEALMKRSHEPDEPNWTPRIAGSFVLEQGQASAWLGIVKAHPFDPEVSIREFFHYDRLYPGYGWCLTTYRGSGVPLPSFQGEPYLLPLLGDPDRLPDALWNHLNEENRVALALKSIDIHTGQSTVILRNRFHLRSRERTAHG